MAIYPDLAGKVILITGGASGIGEALVRAFAQQGAKTAFVDIDAAAGKGLHAELSAAGHTVHFEALDLRDVAALQAGIARVRQDFGAIGVLVNNAAHDERHPALDVTPDYFDDRIAVNLRHQFFASQAVLPDMRSLGGGAIICMSSISWMAGFGGMPVYTASKSAVIGMVRSLARDFGGDNIRVNAITPGWIVTKRQIELWLTPEADAERNARQSLKRRIYPDDIAKLALFLASEDAGAITAQNYIADGGWV
jgi:NAD(P)-dependent dehydrogenase (short-subunit alcohol dehydrogenase family)